MKSNLATSSAITDEWTDTIRTMIKLQGQPLRQSKGYPHTIEVKSLTTNRWHPLLTPCGSAIFASRADRDTVFERITNHFPPQSIP